MVSKKRDITILQTITFPVVIQRENDLQCFVAETKEIRAALAKLNKVEIASIRLEN